jgi:hypothetical protein
LKLLKQKNINNDDYIELTSISWLNNLNVKFLNGHIHKKKK